MEKKKKPGPYDDIINLPHHVSKVHPQMPVSKRAAQFQPFAAVSGYEEKIAEVNRIVGRKIELDDLEREKINRKIQEILYRMENKQEKVVAEIRYFVPDQYKEGGEYRDIFGAIEKINVYRKELVFETGDIIPVQYVLSLDISEDICDM